MRAGSPGARVDGIHTEESERVSCMSDSGYLVGSGIHFGRRGGRGRREEIA